uniref:MYBR1 n=1 Tax=Gentiana crassa subsp. rigescens TaxID=3097545 RepID=A0A0U2DCA8_9GENT|nr:MYBR1 [Gentiana rigescens]
MRKPCYYESKCLNRGAYSRKEDQKHSTYINKHGNGRCYHIPKAPGRHCCGKSCRVRWVNYKKRAKEVKVKGGNNFGEDEEDIFIKLHALLGNRWSLIAGRLPGRTEKEVKNYWDSHLKRKLISMGIDPDNHHPQGPPPGPGYTYGTTTTCTYNNGKGNIHLGKSESSSTGSTAHNINVSDAESCAQVNYSSLSGDF